MDSIRAKFLWQGAGEKFRYHMAKWEMVSRPKDQGGLGIINTKIMNESLLVKWIWKIHLQADDLWYKILKAKYLGDNGFFDSTGAGGSQFWKGLHKVKHLFKWGASFTIGNGKLCRFWEDCWLHEVPLKILYGDLYQLVRDPNVFVNECWNNGSWFVDFKRCLSAYDYDRWLGLLNMLNDCALTDNRADVVHWALDKKKQFTTKSLYRLLTDRGVSSRVAGYIWRSKVPLKIKFFLWQILNNKLQVAVNLVKRGWKGPSSCYLCGCLEDLDHIFFKCHLSKLVWAVIVEIFDLQSYPTSWDDFCGSWLRGKGPIPIRLIIFIFAGFAWALWTTRNKIAIRFQRRQLMFCTLLFH
jgi:hypothetical protein